jgi:hypothetical protein
MVDITTLFQREYLRRVHLPVALGPSAWALLGFEEHRDINRKTSGKDRPFRPFSFSHSANNCQIQHALYEMALGFHGRDTTAKRIPSGRMIGPQ